MNGKYEQQKYQQGFEFVIGCDEVGRGSLAGPVVAAAVILPLRVLSSKPEALKWKQIKDSKLLSPKKREELSEVIKQNCVAYGIGAVESSAIDEMNIHHATLLAMRKAVEELLCAYSRESVIDRSRPGKEKFLLAIDGKFCIPKFDMKQEAVVDGDNKILSVAAASIVAKVYRDALMVELAQEYPAYDLAQHKGYGTLHHREMIIKHGLSDIHRVSFCKNLTF